MPMSRRFRVAALAAAVLPVLFCARLSAQTAASFWDCDVESVTGTGDSVRVSLSVNVGRAALRPSSTVTVEPAIRVGGVAYPLRPVAVYGKRSLRRSATDPATGDASELSMAAPSSPVSISVSGSAPVGPGRDSVDIIVVERTLEGRRRVSSSVRVAASFVRPPRPADVVFHWEPLVPSTEGYSADRTVTFSVPVAFAPGSRSFDTGLGDNAAALDSLSFMIREYTATRRLSVRSAVLKVFSYPDGNDSGAARLTRSRAVSVLSALRRKGVFKYVSPTASGGGEDWEGFRDWVGRSSLSFEPGFIRVFDSGAGHDDVYRSLRGSYPRFMSVLDSVCFPLLSRAEITFTVRKPSYKEPKFLEPYFREVPDALVPAEFWELASTRPVGSDFWLEVVLEALRVRPGDPALSFDAAMCLMDRGSLDTGMSLLRDAAGMPGYEYGLASFLYRSGRKSEALAILDRLAEGSPEITAVASAARNLYLWELGEIQWDRLSK